MGPAILVNAKLGAPGEVSAPDGPTIEGNSITGDAAGIVYTPVVFAPDTPGMPQVAVKGGVYTISGTVAHFNGSKSFTFRIDIYGASTCTPNPQGEVPIGVAKAGPITAGWTFTARAMPTKVKFFMITETGSNTSGSTDVRTSSFSKCAS